MKKPSPSALNARLTSTLPLLAALPRLVVGLPIRMLVARDESDVSTESHSEPLTPEQYWTYLFISAFLVLAGGVFAGLTLGLMGQDEVYLKVISSSGDASEKNNAKKVLRLINRGKHWVLVTLLLSNVITNETLPIVLDRVLGGGWPAVVSSTASIVIFGEVIPQSLCVRYGLQIGAFFTPFVLGLMYIMYPLAYPIACLLDYILGEDHGTIYKKSGLKTLVTLHQSMGVERLNNDEVTIISAVLDLKEKNVHEIMTPLKNVYTMSSDRILDEKCVEEIFNSGFSRIPIHLPGEPTNFIGMLLVRVLISYDPEDALPVSSFPLATLPETPPETSCLNILNYFQEGKSHMVVVSENPGDSEGALGVLTLEDVIEELIGEEIVDESDVFIDIDRAIKRNEPGPLAKRHLTQYLHSLYTSSNRNSMDGGSPVGVAVAAGTGAPRHNTESGSTEPPATTQSAALQFKPHNLASNPLSTNKSFVTIKRQPQQQQPPPTMSELRYEYQEDDEGDDDNEETAFLANNQESSTKAPGSDLNMSTHSISTATNPVSRSASPNYGSNQNTRRPSNKPTGSSHFKKFVIPLNSERDSTDLTEYEETNGSRHDSGSLLNSSREASVEAMEQHSFRTGGIIESVVNVDGVEKTIIQSRPDGENEEETATLLVHDNPPRSRRGSRLN